MDIRDHRDKWLFVPFGGASEIGMNFNAYHYEGKWIIVDCGAGFAGDHYPGINIILPDISFLTQYKDDILCIIITHIHEDHIGGVQHIWPLIQAPVYATPFAADLLYSKLKTNTRFADQVVINKVDIGSSWQIGSFKIDMISLAHSTVEMQALFITTDLGTVFHTGDWHFDDTPLIGNGADIGKLTDAGMNDNILAAIGDSTNIFHENSVGSEKSLRESLINLVSECQNTVIVTTFASNIVRLESIMIAARESGRKVMIAGISLERVINIARDNGYLLDFEDEIFVSHSSINKLPRNQRLIICTGCQGEEMSALSKAAMDKYRYFKLLPNDTVIFSSKIIPGNDKKIAQLENMLIDKSIQVFTEKDSFVHVSGHPCQNDLKIMYDMIDPEIIIPVHGESVHTTRHVQYVEQMGRNGLKISNGSIVNLEPGNTTILEQISPGCMVIDGKRTISPDSPIISSRRKIQSHGVVVVNLVIEDESRELISDPILCCPGILDEIKDQDIFQEIQNLIIENLTNSPHTLLSNQDTTHSTTKIVKNFIKRTLDKYPEVKVIVTSI